MHFKNNYLMLKKEELEVFVSCADNPKNYRPILQGIHFKQDKIESTNAFILLQREFVNELKKEFILPAEIVKKLIKKDLYQVEIDFKLSIAKFINTVTNDIIQCGLIIGDFPKTETIENMIEDIKKDSIKSFIAVKQLENLIKSAKKAKKEVIEFTINSDYKKPILIKLSDKISGFLMACNQKNN